MGRRLLFVAIAATVLIAPPAVPANQATMSRDTFLATTWRVAGPEFSMIPFDGFPITFHPDGTVETRNLGGIEMWSLDNDELVLSGRHATEIRFKWLPDKGVFRHCHMPEKVPLYVFPVRVKDPWRIGCGDLKAAKLTLQIALDKAAYQFGERIVVTATLTNVGDASIFVRRSADETGHDDGFRVELTQYGTANNLQSPAPLPWHQPATAESVPPGGTHSRQLVLNRMVGSPTPGKYRLTMIYSAAYPAGNAQIWSDAITLEVTPQQ